MKRSFAEVEESSGMPDPLSSTPMEKSIVLPKHYYHLSELNYVAVAYFSNTLLIHLREYLLGEKGNLIPTRKGTTLTIPLWLSIIRKSESYKESVLAGDIVIVNDSLLIAKADLDIGPHVTFQRYVRKKDFTRQFCTSMFVMCEKDFVKLMSDRDFQKKISSSVIEELYSRVLPQTVLNEVKKYPSPAIPPQMDLCDIELVLTTSIVELLKSNIEDKVISTFECTGCELHYENQLGHECITYNYAQKLSSCGDIVILEINLEQLSRNFVEMNAHILNYINTDFFTKLDGVMLVQSAKEMFIASDPHPFGMF